MLAKEQSQRRVHDAWEDRINRWCLAATGHVTVARILGECLGIDVGRWTRSDEMRVGKSLQAMGWEQHRPMVDGRRIRVYVPGTTSAENATKPPEQEPDQSGDAYPDDRV